MFDVDDKNTTTGNSDNQNMLQHFILQSKGFQKEVMKYLKNIDTKLNNYDTYANPYIHESLLPPTVDEIRQLNTILKLLPIKDLQDFQVLEEYLSTDDNNIMAFAHELSRQGGETAKEIIRKIMKYTISNELGCMFSWEGHKGKHIFKNLHFAKVLIRAVLLNARTSRTQEDEIIKWIKLWLVRCKDRMVK